VYNEWIVGASNWDWPARTGYCTTNLVGVVNVRKCDVADMVGSAYLFKLSKGVGWSQQQKLVSDDLVDAAGYTDAGGNRPNKLGTRRFGSDVKLTETRISSPSSSSTKTKTGPIVKVLAVSMESSGVADIVRRNVQVYGISSDGSTWSLQQELLANVTVDYTDLSSTDKKINGTSLFTNQDTLIANLYGPGIGYSYIFRPSLAGTWSLQQVISGLDVGAQVFSPVVQGGMLLHGASGGKVVQHSRFQKKTDLAFSYT
jgi:hypothetical protein